MAPSHKSHNKYCLITVGATVGFRDLTASSLDTRFWEALVKRGFTHLRVQCGPDIDWASSRLDSLRSEIPSSLSIEVFEIRKNLLKEEMMLCKGDPAEREPGLVICHAGTGTILDGWRLGISLVVVPNTSLLDDHQTEMAVHLAKQGYATSSSSKLEDLIDSLSKAEQLIEKNKSRWPAHDVPTPDAKPALRLWQISPDEVQREQDEQMNHD